MTNQKLLALATANSFVQVPDQVEARELAPGVIALIDEEGDHMVFFWTGAIRFAKGYNTELERGGIQHGPIEATNEVVGMFAHVIRPNNWNACLELAMRQLLCLDGSEPEWYEPPREISQGLN